MGAGVIEEWEEIAHVRPTLLMHEAAQAIGTILAHPEYLAALARRGITGDMIDQVQIDPWPAGVFGYECEEGRRSRGASRSCATTRPTTATRVRSRASSCTSTTAATKWSRSSTTASRRFRRTAPAISPRTSRGCAPTSSRSRSPSPRVRASPSRATSCSGRSGSSGSRSTRSRVSCCTRSRTTTTTAGCVRSCTARRSARWSSPTATRARCTAGRTRSTRASGASGA